MEKKHNNRKVDWSPVEDNILLTCKVGSIYLSPGKKPHVKKLWLLDKVLHSTQPLSINKTLAACQRRLRYIMKMPSINHNVHMFLEEVKQDPDITKEFSGAKKKLEVLLKFQGPKVHQKEYNKLFVNLVNTLLKKMKVINNMDFTNIDVSVQDSPAEYEFVLKEVYSTQLLCS